MASKTNLNFLDTSLGNEVGSLSIANEQYFFKSFKLKEQVSLHLLLLSQIKMEMCSKLHK